MDLTTDTIAQVIHDCDTCATIKLANRMKPLPSREREGKGDGKSINMEKCGRLTISPCHDLTMVSIRYLALGTYHGGSNHWVA